MPKIFGVEISNCVNCFYKREYQEMGATWNVCERYNDLAEATKAYKNSQNCQYKLTHQQVKEIIKKQTPKRIKRKIIGNKLTLHFCPTCEIRLLSWGHKFCGECGQALDWSDEE